MSADVLENTRPAVIDRRYNAIFSHLLGTFLRKEARKGYLTPFFLTPFFLLP